jgi:CASP C terminal
MLSVELEKTKADNVQLYGKIRYVQDYSQEKLVSRAPKKVVLCMAVNIFVLRKGLIL